MMKIIKNLAVILFMILALISCQNDDEPKVIIPGPPTGTDVRYTVSTSINMLSGIEFRDPTGAMQQALPIQDSPTFWFRTIIVQIPFDAKVNATMKNNSFQEQTYTLQLFVDGILTKTEEGTIAAATNGQDASGNAIIISGTKTGTLTYQL